MPGAAAGEDEEKEGGRFFFFEGRERGGWRRGPKGQSVAFEGSL
jgi:hypothetical protein